MIIFKRSDALSGWLEKETSSGRSIGFVPTLGALHEGHISLITISKKATDITVCSIFVNPTQFNDPKDFQKYPVTLEKDIALLETAGADILFLPGVTELYPTGTADLEHYDLGRLEHVTERGDCRRFPGDPGTETLVGLSAGSGANSAGR